MPLRGAQMGIAAPREWQPADRKGKLESTLNNWRTRRWSFVVRLACANAKAAAMHIFSAGEVEDRAEGNGYTERG